MKIGFAGLGRMGAPMALNLLATFTDMVAVSRSGRRLAEFQARGSVATTDPARLADADVVFLCLPDGAAVAEYLFGDGALASRLAPGAIVVDLGTSAFGTTLDVARRLGEFGVGFLDAPVSGMERRAIDGTLAVMCGGPLETFERVRPCLDCIGNTVLHMGPVGSGQLTKLINQLLFNINTAALAEVLPVATKLGLDAERVAQVVNSGTGRSYASEFFLPDILEDRFSNGYPMQAAYKDLVAGAHLSADFGYPMPVLAAATATYQAALLRGLGTRNKGAMIMVFEELLGSQFRAAR